VQLQTGTHFLITVNAGADPEISTRGGVNRGAEAERRRRENRGAEVERRRRENRGAEGAEGGGVWDTGTS